MTQSVPVAEGMDATHHQYNLLRADVLDPTLGHRHTGAADGGFLLFGRGLLSARPAAGVTGRLYHATDEGILYRDNGTVWEVIGLHLSMINTGWDRQSFSNLLVNGDFEVGDPPTGWVVQGTLVRSTAQVRIGAFSGALTNVAGAEGNVEQTPGNLPYFSGRTVTMGSWVWANVAGRASLWIWDNDATGFAGSNSSFHPGDSTWRWLTVTRTLRAGLTNLIARCHTLAGTSITAFFDGVMLVEGSVCPAFSPRPAEFRNISASEVVRERFPMDRMLDGAAGQYIRGAGAGLNPTYSAIPVSDVPVIDDTRHGSRGAGLHADSHGRVHDHSLAADGSPIARAAVPWDFPHKLKPALVRWALPGWYAHSWASVGMTSGWTYNIPIFVSETTTYIRIGIEVTVAAAGSADLRVFNWGDGRPSSQLFSAGTVDTGTIGIKEIIISLTLTRGYYFLTAVYNATPSCRGLAITDAIAPPVAGLMHSPMQPHFPILGSNLPLTDPAPYQNASFSAAFAHVYLREN